MYFNIEEELKKLPSCPGVYIMHDENDQIIYVGKAISLRNRVRQYFQKSTKKTAKIEKMVSLVKWFEYIVADSEMEALILECNLIKEHSPRYNTMLKDDKSYPFIKVTVDEDYPRILFAHRRTKDKGKYFGPFTSSTAVKDTIELLQKLYHVRTCNRVLPRDIGKDRPCLNYQIHQCYAPCQGYIDKKTYQQNIRQAIDFLNGNYSGIEEMLTEKMMDASEKMEFEEAAKYRDLLNSVRQIIQKQKITTDENDDRDVIAYSRDLQDAVVQIFFIRNGKLLGREHFHMTIAPFEEGKQILTSFMKQYYGGTPFIPKEIFLSDDIEEKEILEQWLSAKRGAKVTIKRPKIGQKEKLVELAKKNADLVLSQDKEKIKWEEMRTKGAVREIEQWLGLEGITRMEAYDISNTSGFQSVGSMVVYENGKPKRNDYRKFKIKSVEGPNDYASMEEVLTRRFEHGLQEKQNLLERLVQEGMKRQNAYGRNRLEQEEMRQNQEKGNQQEGMGMDYVLEDIEAGLYDGALSREGQQDLDDVAYKLDMQLGSFTIFPDLILMDGGRGQVNIALEVLDKLHLNIPVCGMVKDDHHRTRGLYFNNVEIPIDTHSEGFRLITRIQDEAHRFAITYHKSLRGKQQVHSILDDIPGVGAVRRKQLMQHFHSLDELKNASVEQISKLPSMNEKVAKQIYEFFH